jgi:hypothetical protein
MKRSQVDIYKTFCNYYAESMEPTCVELPLVVV